MLLPVKWLKDYVDLDIDIKTLADGLTLSGSHIESIIDMDRGIKNVVVGEILKIEAHPDADKLVICQVNVGEEILQIVTAATNVFEGAKVPVALVGAVLFDNFKIKKGKLRGVESFGMFCSLAEFGFDDSVIPVEFRDGVLILKEDVEVGLDIKDVLNMKDYVFEIEITPNRPDCLSILGMARETAATFSRELKEPKIEINNEVEDIKDYVEGIEIDSDNCNRYYTRVIKDVKVGDSPLWLQTKIMEAGMRPINNIVDASNYVMLEYGQPLHTFDLEKIQGRQIIVRQADDDEVITTLDSKERKLSHKDLVIADRSAPIAIAGVMGGFDSEVTRDTSLVLLESANFNGKSIRLTSNKFALRSEASTRYEKEVDSKICKDAADRFCQIIESIGAGTIVKGSIDLYENPTKEAVILLRPEMANRRLGIEISPAEMTNYLVNLGLRVEETAEGLVTTVPTVRQDLKMEIDLIEEIGRLYGFHNIEAKPLVGTLTRGEKPFFRIIEDKSKNILSGLGLSEILTYSFISPKAYDLTNVAEDSPLRNFATLLNPLGQDYSIMRTTLIPNMLETISRNYNRKIENVFFYEIGNIFKPQEIPVVNIPLEKRTLIVGGYGNLDFYRLKEVMTILLGRLGIDQVDIERETNNNTFHPGRTARLILNGQVFGVLGEIHPDVLANYNIKTRAYVAELDYDIVTENAKLARNHRELPKYPAMVRDLALVLDEDIMVGEIEAIILKNGKKLIEEVKLFDIYTGDQIPEGKKSVAYTIRYRASDRTLTDEEVNKVEEKLIKELKSNLNADLRS